MVSDINIDAFNCILVDMSMAINSKAEAKEIARLFLKRITRMVNAKGALIRTLEPYTNLSELAVSYGLSDQYLAKGPVSWEKAIVELTEKKGIRIIDDVLHDPRIQYPKAAWEEGIRMIVDVPLTHQSKVIGLFRVFFDEQRILTREEIKFLIFTSRQGSCAIEKAGLIEKQRNQYEQLERQTEKLSALGGMVAGIAHEINNPLAGILLYSSNMAKKIPEGDPIKEGLEIVISETKRCKAIIQDLLEFSRAGQPEASPSNINDIIEKVLFILSNEFSLHHIVVEKHLSSEMVDLRLDEKQIQQVFVNVLLNAIHAIEDRGTIAVRSHLFLDQEVVRVEITDSGCGIPENELTKIFEPFFSTKKNGTGLGLSVSYGIIRKHGGDIYALSQPDKGSSFIITLPLSNQAGKTA